MARYSTPYHHVGLSIENYCFPLPTSIGTLTVFARGPGRFSIYMPGVLHCNDQDWRGYITCAVLCRDRSWRFRDPLAYISIGNERTVWNSQPTRLSKSKGSEKQDLRVISNIVKDHFFDWWEHHQDEAILAGLKVKSEALVRLMQFANTPASRRSRLQRQIQVLNRQLLDAGQGQNKSFDESTKTESAALTQLLQPDTK